MKLKILDPEKKETGSKDLPAQFNEEVRPDLIKRAVLSLQANRRQPYGTSPEAGKRHSTRVSKRRRDYRGCYGFGISRVPRKVLSRRGTRMNWEGALAPGTKGGRRAHPPKADKQLSQKINKKENRKAIRSALAAILSKELVEKRGHKVPAGYPFIIDQKFESFTKTKQVNGALLKLGLKDELERVEKKTIRAGKGKMRGRKYVKKKGPLLVVGNDCSLLKAARNLQGFDIVLVNKLNAELLAPGTTPGRLTLFTTSAIEKLDKEKLFM